MVYCKGSKLASLLQLSWAQAFQGEDNAHPPETLQVLPQRGSFGYYTNRRGRGQVWRDWGDTPVNPLTLGLLGVLRLLL